MRVGTEALLMLAALALYLSDSILLFASNEAALLRGRRGRWRAGFGLDRWRLAGKEPYLPNPFTPQAPLLRLHWRMRAPAAAAAGAPLVLPAELDRFALHAWVSWLCLFVWLPVVLFQPQGLVFTLTAVLVLYLNIVVAMVRLQRCRTAFVLPARDFAVLAFECLVCPPFSINLVRKLSARAGVREDLVSAAMRLLPADALPAFKVQCLRRLDEAIESEGEDSPDWQSLRAGRERFVVAETEEA